MLMLTVLVLRDAVGSVEGGPPDAPPPPYASRAREDFVARRTVSWRGGVTGG